MEYTKEELEKSPILSQDVPPEGPLKEMLVQYAGSVIQPEDDIITVEMIIEVVANEFPEFIMALAEENFVRGYQQAANDFSDFEEYEKERLAKEVITYNIGNQQTDSSNEG